jgi:hypothetical protein
MKQLFFGIAMWIAASAQAQIQAPRPPLLKGMELQELQILVNRYQQFDNLVFDTRITKADSASPNVITDSVLGHFELQGSRSVVVIDSVEIINGNDYNVTLFHREREILISNKAQANNRVLQVPLSDSLFMQANIDSVYFAQQNDSIKTIHFRFHPFANFYWYQIKYNRYTYLIQQTKLCAKGGGTPNFIVSYDFMNYGPGSAKAELMTETRAVERSVNGGFSSRTAYGGYTVTDLTR